MPEKWKPDLPPCTTLVRAVDWLTIRDTPAPFGRNLGSVAPGEIIRIDREDKCLLYRGTFQYTRLVSTDEGELDEPAYIAIGRAESRGYRDIVLLERYLEPYRDDCDDGELPEEELMDFIDLELEKMDAALNKLHDHLGTDGLKAKLPARMIQTMQKLVVGVVTPDPVPDVPPVEEWPPTPPPPPAEEVPEPAPVRVTTPFRAVGNRIYKDGSLFPKFIGVNHRGIAWYGVGDVLPHSNEGQIAAQLDFDRRMETDGNPPVVQVVRFYAAHHKHDVEFAIPRVKRILDMLHERGMYGVVCLTDGAHSGFHAPDNPGNRGIFIKGNERYSKAWIEEKKYRERYLPYATEMVKAIANHPAIFSIQPINELTTIDDTPTERYMNAVIDFYQEVIGMIKRESPNSMTSTGLVSAHEVFGFAADGSRNAYADFKGAEKLYKIVDYASVHSYQDEKAPNEALGSTRENLVHEFKMAGIPHVWEEMMMMHTDPTTNWLDKALRASAGAVVGWQLWNPCWDIGDNNDCDGLKGKNDGHGGAKAHNLKGWTRAWSETLRVAT